MRFVRKKCLRIFSVFTLLTILNSVLYPAVSYALTSGPHQPEFTSYEDSGSTDLVNLLTGDFSMTMPILNIPTGADGSFNVPLSYHAGISPDHEASWVGLGFNINIGSITRGINGFPDDAKGSETQTVQVKDLTGHRGWNSSVLGSNVGWDSQVGRYGSIAISGYAPGPMISYNKNGITTAEAMGITLGDGGVKFDAVKFSVDAVNVVMSICSYGTSSAAQAAINIAVEVGTALIMEAVMPDLVPSTGAAGLWTYSNRKNDHLYYTNYWTWLDQSRIEQMYGSLYLDAAPLAPLVDGEGADKRVSINGGSLQPLNRFLTGGSNQNNIGAASDINIDLSDATKDDYENNSSPTRLAYDNFSVNAPGISGSIKPYRLEIGSVAVPRQMTGAHTRISPIPFLDYGSNKVPFVYEGSIANKYFHHSGGTSSVSSPGFNFNINSTFVPGNNTPNNNNDVLRYDLSDVIFANERIRTDLATKLKLPQSHFVEWLTNGEIKNTTDGFSSKSYIDYFSGTDRSLFRTNYPFGGRQSYYAQSSTFSNGVIQFASNEDVNFNQNDKVDVNVTTYAVGDANMEQGELAIQSYQNLNVSSVDHTNHRITVNVGVNFSGQNAQIEVVSKTKPKPDHSIGGFTITSSDGMNYHFTIPVYDYDFRNETIDVSDANKKSIITRAAPIANTWLLTAITGPDFVDRGGSNNGPNGIIDPSDWGYWIKFNYGRHSHDFHWRFPYSTTGSTYQQTSDALYKIYSEGNKEKYYLNSIETRSHVALFIKDARSDSKDASTTRRSSLRLAEIALMTKDAYDQLINPSDIYDLKAAAGVIDFLYQYSGSSDPSGNITGNRLTYIQTKALRRIIFNHNYSLCPGTSNSDASGKLTLTSISVLGRNSMKVFPDYKFDYGTNNPTYNADKWDGWGMYASQATALGSNHKVSTVNSDGSAWSLVKVTNPEGSQINVSYERDSYSSISGEYSFNPGGGISYSTQSGYTVFYTGAASSLGDLKVASPSQFQVGDVLKVSGTVSFSCVGAPNPAIVPYSGIFTVASVGASSINLGTDYMGMGDCTASQTVTINSNSGTIIKADKNKLGGNLRVGSITIHDDFGGDRKLRYLYSNDNGTSSGVIAQEPDYIKLQEFNFYKYLGYPFTPVFYGQVSVLAGKLTTDSDYTTKEIYNFETPNKSQYQLNTVVIKNKESRTFSYYNDGDPYNATDYSSLVKHEITDRTSKIGKLISNRVFDKNGILVSSQACTYTDVLTNEGVSNHQGIFSEGTLLFESILKLETGLVDYVYYEKGQRTTILQYPYVLKKLTSTTDGISTHSENKNWDLITGLTLETHVTSALGITYKSIVEPAYKVATYAEFGSKSENTSNKNMLTQLSASYTYRLDEGGNEIGLMSATATKWKRDWTNYRANQGGVFVNSNEISDLNNDMTISPAEIAAQQVWRKSETYAWLGNISRLNEFGVHNFSSSDKFDFTGGSNPLWRKMNSIERFNHDSQILEAKDVNGLYTSTKYGLLPIATAVNAKYDEIAFSGAEDLSNLFFSGEVAVGSGSVVSSPVHSGKSALSLSTGYGFVYKSSGILANKTYKASVWVSNVNGKIYYKINNGAEQLPTLTVSPVFNLKNGTTWYRIDAVIPVGNVSTPSIEVGVKSVSGTVIFDDFRFQPFDAAMNCYVYSPDTRNVEYVFDNDNVFTRYEYNDRGLLIKTFSELVQTVGANSYTERQASETKTDFRRFYIDQ